VTLLRREAGELGRRQSRMDLVPALRVSDPGVEEDRYRASSRSTLSRQSESISVHP